MWEPVIQPAAKSGPDRWPPASLQCCLAPGDGCLRQEAFNLHGGNLEFRGTSFPLQGAQWNCATWAFARRSPFHLSLSRVLLSTRLGNRGNTHPLCTCRLAVALGIDGQKRMGGGGCLGWRAHNHLGWGAFQKVSLLPTTGFRHCHIPVGRLSRMGIPLDGVETASFSSSVQGLIGLNRGLFISTSSLSLPPKSRAQGDAVSG